MKVQENKVDLENFQIHLIKELKYPNTQEKEDKNL
jgi:hypothetical protein